MAIANVDYQIERARGHATATGSDPGPRRAPILISDSLEGTRSLPLPVLRDNWQSAIAKAANDPQSPWCYTTLIPTLRKVSQMNRMELQLGSFAPAVEAGLKEAEVVERTWRHDASLGKAVETRAEDNKKLGRLADHDGRIKAIEKKSRTRDSRNS